MKICGDRTLLCPVTGEKLELGLMSPAPGDIQASNTYTRKKKLELVSACKLDRMEDAQKGPVGDVYDGI